MIYDTSFFLSAFKDIIKYNKKSDGIHYQLNWFEIRCIVKWMVVGHIYYQETLYKWVGDQFITVISRNDDKCINSRVNQFEANIIITIRRCHMRYGYRFVHNFEELK